MKTWITFLLLIGFVYCAQANNEVEIIPTYDSTAIQIKNITRVDDENEYSALPALTKQERIQNEESGQSIDLSYTSKYGYIPIQQDGSSRKRDYRNLWKRVAVTGWHHFDVVYEVTGETIDRRPSVNKIPEITITYALLYDMSKSKLLTQLLMNAAKADCKVDWYLEDIKNPHYYVMVTRTITYQNIAHGQEHRARVCVPPSFIVAYGLPVCFSAELKMNGKRQGEVMTQMCSGVKIEEHKLSSLLVEKNAKGESTPSAWWKSIRTISSTVGERLDVLQDRSMTPFYMFNDFDYNQVKQD
ncbi:MAG: hypothetical protein RR133_01080 [Kiritimatiellia bacterium]